MAEPKNTWGRALREIKNNEGRYVEFEDLYTLDDWTYAIVVFKEDTFPWEQNDLMSRCFVVDHRIPHFTKDTIDYHMSGTNMNFTKWGCKVDWMVFCYGVEKVYIYY